MRILRQTRQLICEYLSMISHVEVTPSYHVKGTPSSNIGVTPSHHVEGTTCSMSDIVHTPSCHVEGTTPTYQVDNNPSFTW